MPDIAEIEVRGFAAEVRAVDVEGRKATFLAATEAPVRTIFGPEVLRIGGLDLKRYRKNPVVLDAHDRVSSRAVIGKADVIVEGRELLATVTFAETARAEETWQLVKGGFVRAMSVGFVSQDVLMLAAGEGDGRGETRVVGPARVVKQSELFELSILPVPADAKALRRSADDDLRQIVVPLVQALDRFTKQEPAMADDKKKPDAAPVEKSAETKVEETRAPAVPGEPTSLRPAVSPVVAQSAEIRAICPRGMEAVADRCILEGKTLDEARAIMLAEAANKTKPVGTPDTDATKVAGVEKRSDGDRKVADVSDDEFRSMFTGR